MTAQTTTNLYCNIFFVTHNLSCFEICCKKIVMNDKMYHNGIAGFSSQYSWSPPSDISTHAHQQFGPRQHYFCEVDVLVMISHGIYKGWSRLIRFIMFVFTKSITGPVYVQEQGSDWNNFHEKPPQFQASYLTNCGCIKSRSKTASGLLWNWAEPDCRVRFGSFHLINLRYLTLSSFHDFHLRFIYKYLVQFQQSASF